MNVAFKVYSDEGLMPETETEDFNLGFYTSLFDSLFGIIFSTLYGASNHQIVDKKNSTEFSLKASRAEIRFHTNLGLSKPSFEQPSPGHLAILKPEYLLQILLIKILN